MSKTRKKTKQTQSPVEFLPIPDRLYFTIGEAAELSRLKTHVIRYWETEFRELTPLRRRNRRYYKRKDIELIRQIRVLLYDHGFTIEGARQALAQAKRVPASTESTRQPTLDVIATKLESILNELNA